MDGTVATPRATLAGAHHGGLTNLRCLAGAAALPGSPANKPTPPPPPLQLG